MDFDGVIAAHSAWKGHLRAFLEGRENLDSSTVANQHACAFGKWIFGEGARYRGTAEYETVVKLHGEFHKCAAAVVAQGRAADATKAIGPSSAFAQASSKLVHAIMKLRSRVAA